MTTLSLQRVVKIKSSISNYKKPAGANKWDAFYISVAILSIVLMACLFALVPLIEALEDWFVNGIYYGEQNTLFIGTPGKLKHIDVLKEYYGRLRITSKSLDWSLIRNLVYDMFSKDYSGIKFTKLQFYGNDAVCLFKYFVTTDDPQYIYVWLTIGLHLLCLSIISVSYLAVWRITVSSSAVLTAQGKGESILQKQIRKRNFKLQRKVGLIIGSNLICWIPFVFISLLHAAKVINAEPSYSIFSLVLLPVNSVTNPIILNDTIMEKLRAAKRRVFLAVSKQRLRWLEPRQTRAAMPGAQDIEMRDIIPNPLPETNLEAHRSVELVEFPHILTKTHSQQQGIEAVVNLSGIVDNKS